MVNWNEVAVENSRYQDLDSNAGSLAWGVIQARIIDQEQVIGGFVGTAWPVYMNEHFAIFVTAEHIIRNETFFSKANEPKAVFMFLANKNGSSIILYPQDRVFFPKLDIGFLLVPVGRIPEINSLKVIDFSSESPSRFSLGSLVYNIGFPDRGHMGNKIGINFDSKPPRVYFEKGPWLQTGSIAGIHSLTTFTSDVCVSGARVFCLDYTSEPGFSGGPLVEVNTNRVIGMMSMVRPPMDGESAPTQSFAITGIEIYRALNELIAKV